MTPSSEPHGSPSGPSTNTSSKSEPERTRNDGRWTEPQFRKFVIRNLRRAAWPVKYEALSRAFVGIEINPRTGKKRKTYACAHCNGKFGSSEVQVDHIIPVQAGGNKDWESVINRLFCELDGFQVLCAECHETKSVMENAGISREMVPALKAVAAFRKMKAKDQSEQLGRLGLPIGTNPSQRVTTYAEWARINVR